MKKTIYFSWVVILFGLGSSSYLFHLNYDIWKILFLVDQPLLTEIPQYSWEFFLGILLLSVVVAILPSKLTEKRKGLKTV